MDEVTCNRFLERMLQIDPRYGEQHHQKQFLARYMRRQELGKCLADHEHDNACYRKDGRDGSFTSWGV